MKDQIRYFIAGIFIGISDLLPGISGATVALMFGVYERILIFLSKLKGFDLIIAILMIGYGIFLLINTYLKELAIRGLNFYINLFIAIVIGLYLSRFHTLISEEPQIMLLVILGFIACSFLLFPGISGSAFLLSVGVYSLIIQSISNFNFNVLLPFGIGMLAALVLMPKLINKVYEKYGKSILVFFGGLILAAGINGLLSVVT